MILQALSPAILTHKSVLAGGYPLWLSLGGEKPPKTLLFQQLYTWRESLLLPLFASSCTGTKRDTLTFFEQLATLRES